MIPASFDYERPATLSQARAVLAGRPDATILAGGHLLLPQMKHGRIRPRLLVDLDRIEDLHGITIDPAVGTATIGAMTTSAQIERSAALANAVPLMPRAAAQISDPLIRERATIGGSLVSAEPRGDWPAIAVASAATLLIQDRDGEHHVGIDAFLRTADTFRAPSASGILISVSVPVHAASTRSVYLKRVHPASGYAMLGVAIVADIQDGICRHCRIGLAGAETRRAAELERVLAGRPLGPETASAAQAIAAELASALGFIDDVNASAAYRADLFPLYIHRAVAALAAENPPKT